VSGAGARPTHGDGKWKKNLMIRDSIADVTLQQRLTRATDFDMIDDLTGHAIFEATHGTLWFVQSRRIFASTRPSTPYCALA
jgi:isocitrate dehydrogenase